LIPLTAGYAGDLNQELIRASLGGNTAAVKTLLEKGADINSKDDSGHTALICAAKFGNTETVQVLLPKMQTRMQKIFGMRLPWAMLQKMAISPLLKLCWQEEQI
jgi:hypothetical protein